MRLVTVLSNSTHARTQKLKIVEKMLADVGIPGVNQVCILTPPKISQISLFRFVLEK